MLAEPRRPVPRFLGAHAPARPRWAAARTDGTRRDGNGEYAPIPGETRSFACDDQADGRLSGTTKSSVP